MRTPQDPGLRFSDLRLRRKMLRSLALMLACLVAQSSALALQLVPARSAGAVRAGAVRMLDLSESTRDSEADAEAERMAKMLAHLRAPIRQYEGGWGDTAMRDGGKNKDRFGKGPTPHLIGTEDDGGGIEGDNTAKATGSAEVIAAGKELPAEKQAQCVLPEESFKVSKLAMSNTDEDFVIECSLEKGETEGEISIDIEPMFLTKEEYFFGFTSDSDPKISIDHGMSSDAEGESFIKASLLAGIMEESVSIKLRFKPGFVVGESDAYLCVILPNEEHSSKFYKITGKCT